MTGRMIHYCTKTALAVRWTIQDLIRFFKDGPNFPPIAPIAVLAQEGNSVWTKLERQKASSCENKRGKMGSILDDIWGEGFLWGVPKKLRTYEVRMSRRFETRYWNPAISNRILRPRRNLTACDSCGHFKEAHTLCRYCYDKIVEETKAIKEKIQGAFGLNAIEKEAKVIYDDEPKPSDADEAKVLVEMGKKRPEWFTKSLLQKSGEGSQEALSDGSVSSPLPQATIK